MTEAGPEEAAAPRSGHECCAPPTGVSSSDRGCCDEHDGAEADLLRSAPVPMPSLSEFAVVRVEPVARPERAPRRSVVLSPAPAPAVLRI